MLRRLYVAGVLWIDYDQDAANANLRTALWRLKRLPYPLLETTPTHLSLARGVVVDVHEATAAARRLCSADQDRRSEDLDDVMVAGELLPDWYDDWVAIERERFRQARLHTLETVCLALMEDRRYGEAVEVGLTAVAAEPLRESAHRAVMRIHLAEGNRGEALRQYDHCRRLLGRLGLRPSPDMEELRLRCANGDGPLRGAATRRAPGSPAAEWSRLGSSVADPVR